MKNDGSGSLIQNITLDTPQPPEPGLNGGHEA